jgi:putative oxidoreductase
MSFSSWDMRTDHVRMKILTTISRFLLALIFLVFGLNGFLHFIPMPSPTGVAGQFMGAMFVTKYLVFVFAIQLIGGVLLLINRFVPLGLTLLAPVIVNILLFHSLMALSGLGIALFVAILWGIVFASVRRLRELLKRESRLARRQCVATHVSFRQPNEQSTNEEQTDEQNHQSY